MLRGQDAFHFYLSQQKSFKPYVDPELADNHSTHSDFLTRRRAAGMLRFRASPKNYGSLSLQLLTRFKEPPKSELLAASAVYFSCDLRTGLRVPRLGRYQKTHATV